MRLGGEHTVLVGGFGWMVGLSPEAAWPVTWEREIEDELAAGEILEDVEGGAGQSGRFIRDRFCSLFLCLSIFLSPFDVPRSYESREDTTRTLYRSVSLIHDSHHSAPGPIQHDRTQGAHPATFSKYLANSTLASNWTRHR